MTAPDRPENLRDWGLSWIRTAVPLLWGYVLTFLAARLPAVHDLLTSNPYIPGLLAGLAALAWYAVVRRLESRLPAWLTRLVIGANTPPRYVEGEVIRGRTERFDGDGPSGPLPPAAPGLRQA